MKWLLGTGKENLEYVVRNNVGVMVVYQVNGDWSKRNHKLSCSEVGVTLPRNCYLSKYAKNIVQSVIEAHKQLPAPRPKCFGDSMASDIHVIVEDFLHSVRMHTV